MGIQAKPPQKCSLSPKLQVNLLFLVRRDIQKFMITLLWTLLLLSTAATIAQKNMQWGRILGRLLWFDISVRALEVLCPQPAVIQACHKLTWELCWFCLGFDFFVGFVWDLIFIKNMHLYRSHLSTHTTPHTPHHTTRDSTSRVTQPTHP